MSAKEIQNHCHRRWNPMGRVPLAQWLLSEAKPVDLERLHVLGNIVMPPCARLGLHLLGHHHGSGRTG